MSDIDTITREEQIITPKVTSKDIKAIGLSVCLWSEKQAIQQKLIDQQGNIVLNSDQWSKLEKKYPRGIMIIVDGDGFISITMIYYKDRSFSRKKNINHCDISSSLRSAIDEISENQDQQPKIYQIADYQDLVFLKSYLPPIFFSFCKNQEDFIANNIDEFIHLLQLKFFRLPNDSKKLSDLSRYYIPQIADKLFCPFPCSSKPLAILFDCELLATYDKAFCTANTNIDQYIISNLPNPLI